MMKKLLTSVLTAALLGVGAMAGQIQMVNDSELESVSAQGFFLNFQTIDTVLQGTNGGYTPQSMVQLNPRQLSMVDSLFVSGNAQQNAFVPVNAANSAVNVPINIVIVMNSQLSGGININNMLNAAVTNP